MDLSKWTKPGSSLYNSQEWDNSDQLCQEALPLKDDNTFYYLSYIPNHKSYAECWFNKKSSAHPAENQNQNHLIFSVETTTVLSIHHTPLCTFLGLNGRESTCLQGEPGNPELPAQSSSEILPLHQGHSQPDSPDPTAHWDSERFHHPDKLCTAWDLLRFLNRNFKDIPCIKVLPTKGIRFGGFFSSHIIPNASKL